MGSILRSIYADYRSLLFDKPPSQSFLGLRNALLREGTREEALRTSLWTTFCLTQFNEGRHCNYSGELRNGSSLHAGFYDLILFFPVSSFILILDRCV